MTSAIVGGRFRGLLIVAQNRNRLLGMLMMSMLMRRMIIRVLMRRLVERNGRWRREIGQLGRCDQTRVLLSLSQIRLRMQRRLSFVMMIVRSASRVRIRAGWRRGWTRRYQDRFNQRRWPFKLILVFLLLLLLLKTRMQVRIDYLCRQCTSIVFVVCFKSSWL